MNIYMKNLLKLFLVLLFFPLGTNAKSFDSAEWNFTAGSDGSEEPIVFLTPDSYTYKKPIDPLTMGIDITFTNAFSFGLEMYAYETSEYNNPHLSMLTYYMSPVGPDVDPSESKAVTSYNAYNGYSQNIPGEIGWESTLPIPFESDDIVRIVSLYNDNSIYYKIFVNDELSLSDSLKVPNSLIAISPKVSISVGGIIKEVSLIPEPSSYVAVFGIFALVFAIYRRKK